MIRKIHVTHTTCMGHTFVNGAPMVDQKVYHFKIIIIQVYCKITNVMPPCLNYARLCSFNDFPIFGPTSLDGRAGL